MTPATLRRMEWAGAPIMGLDNIPIRTCPDCCVSERRGHAPDCALDAAIREAEKGEPMPDLQVGDEVSMAQTVTFRREDAAAGWRPARPLSVKRNGVVIWRQEPPTL